MADTGTEIPAPWRTSPQAPEAERASRLYFKYLYLLGAIPNRRPRRQTALVSWREVIKFDRYQEQFIYLMKNRIETMGPAFHAV